MREALLEYWLRDDPDALARVYNEGSSRPIGKHALEHRKRLSQLKSQSNTSRLRSALQNAVLLAGGGHPNQGDGAYRVVHPNAEGSLPKLFPYQQEAVRVLRAAAETNEPLCGLLVMPTGSGKTRTAVSWLVQDRLAKPGQKVLWVTHRRELLEQTVLDFETQLGSRVGSAPSRLRLVGGRFAPASTLASGDFDVAIATTGAISHNYDALSSLLVKHDVTVVIDEAHHSTASTWRRVISLAKDNGCTVVGLTATPKRMAPDEERLLLRLYENNRIHTVDARSLITKGYMARPITRQVSTQVVPDRNLDPADLEHLNKFNEISPRMADSFAKNAARNERIVNTWIQGPTAGSHFGPTLAFAVNQLHAQSLSEAFNGAGVRADWVAHTRPDRDKAIDRFRKRDIDVLVNVEILTEGVDLPNVETVLLCRPTQSEVLFKQMIGRALRGPAVNGTEVAHLVSFRDHWEKFSGWLEPKDVLPSDGAEELPVEPAASAVSPETRRYEAPTEDIIREAAREAAALWHVSIGETYQSVPVGWYSFALEHEVVDGEVETRRHIVFVAEHQVDGYFEFEAAAAEQGTELETDGEALQEEFFGAEAEPLPMPDHLSLLAQFVRAEGRFPERNAIQSREEVDPRRVAEAIVSLDLKYSNMRGFIEDRRASAPELVEEFWGGADAYVEEVLQLVTHRSAHGTFPSDLERRAPRVSVAERADWEYGHGSHDLVQLLEEVRTDPTLFPDGPIPEPEGGIEWSSTRPRSWWGLYEPKWRRIRLSPVLNSPELPVETLKMVIFHELLHCEDHQRGVEHPIHGPEFRPRERRFPGLAESLAWLDTFDDHYIAVPAEEMAR